ncbi:MAG: C25 family cysteine peptidase [Candidatus Hodarchaeota archaeon]
MKGFYNKLISFLILLALLSPPFIVAIATFNDNYRADVEKLDFISPSNGYQDVNLSLLPDIDYIALNQSWYDPNIEMLIITPDDQDFVDAITPLMNWKNEKGVKTIILSNYSAYSGSDNAEKIRNMIKSYYEQENVQWVLLAGDAEGSLIPIREVYNPDVVDVPGESEYSNWDDYYKPTDFYYADLDGTWDNDNDGKWGENSTNNAQGVDEISWTPEVYVGRFPADNAIELAIMVNKSLKYENDPLVGDWMNKMLLAGGISMYSPPEDEARLTQYIWQHYTLTNMNFTHLVKTTSNFTPTIPPPPNEQLPLSPTNFVNKFNSNYSTIIFAGHGDPYTYADESGSIYFTNTDASLCINFDKPSLIYADVCTTSSYDKNDDSIGETLIKKTDSGAIGYIGGIRVNWFLPIDTYLEKLNRGNAKLFWEEFFQEKKFQQGKALYDSKVSYLNSDYFKRGATSIQFEYQRKNVLTYNLLGDPELDVYTNIPMSVPDLFVNNIYEGQCVSLTIKDNNGSIVPYARIHLRTSDGKYRTVYANKEGEVAFRLPVQPNEFYNVTITGHNLIPSKFNFSTLSDVFEPQLLDFECVPKNPTISDNIHFTFQAYDNQSGIESIFLLLSDNNFKDYTYYQLGNEFQENNQEFHLEFNKLKPGDYSYVIVLRDYSNKTKIIHEEDYRFSIPKPLTDYILIVVLIMVITLAGVSFYIMYLGIKENSVKFRTLI